MKDKIELVMLLDFYRNLLTERGRKVLEDYLERDLGISEIAAERGVSRQAILDTINRQEEKLAELEDKLQLVARFKNIRAELIVLQKKASPEIKKQIDKIFDML